MHYENSDNPPFISIKKQDIITSRGLQLLYGFTLPRGIMNLKIYKINKKTNEVEEFVISCPFLVKGGGS